MRNLNKKLENKKINYTDLTAFGFIKNEDNYYYEENILNNKFKVIININNDITSKVIENNTSEEYILVDIDDATGNFVGQVRDAYEKVISNFINNCTNENIFKNKQTKELIKYVKEKYNDDLEYLWENFPNNAVWRNKDNQKWYAAILTCKESHFGSSSDNIIEIIDLKYQKEDIKNIIDNKKIYPGYHMNKSSWITIKLDGSVPTKEIYNLIDNSYFLSLMK